jgi:hypothetical protein
MRFAAGSFVGNARMGAVCGFGRDLAHRPLQTNISYM